MNIHNLTYSYFFTLHSISAATDYHHSLAPKYKIDIMGELLREANCNTAMRKQIYADWVAVYGGEGYRMEPGLLEQEFHACLLEILAVRGDYNLCNWDKLL